MEEEYKSREIDHELEKRLSFLCSVHIKQPKPKSSISQIKRSIPI